MVVIRGVKIPFTEVTFFNILVCYRPTSIGLYGITEELLLQRLACCHPKYITKRGLYWTVC